MANELNYRDATGKTVTVTVDGPTGSLGTIAAAETAGLYQADMPAAPDGIYSLYWENTTDSTVYRDQFVLDTRASLTAQATRDAMALNHTDGTAGLDKFLRGLQALVIRR